MRTAVIFLVCLASANAFFLNPASLNNPRAFIDKLVCPNPNIVASQKRAFEGERQPWFQCTGGQLLVQSCNLELSTPQSCPIVYNNNDNNLPASTYSQCSATSSFLSNTNCTSFLKSNCDGKVECNFAIGTLPTVFCNNPAGANAAQKILEVPNPDTQLQLRVIYSCSEKRRGCKFDF
jgi:hypothetical protein